MSAAENIFKSGKLLKNPVFLGIAVVVFVVLIIAFSRRGGAGSSADATLASQNIASGTNVALSSAAYDYGKAALQYKAALAGIAADVQARDMESNTAIVLHSLSSVDNQNELAARQALTRENIAGSIAINSQNNDAAYRVSKLNADTTITLAPHIESLAAINAGAEVAKARVSADASTRLAEINAAYLRSRDTKSLFGATTHDVIGNAPALWNMIGGSGAGNFSLGSIFGSGAAGATEAGAADLAGSLSAFA